MAHDGAAHGNALALSAGKLARLAVEQGLEAEDLRGAIDLLLDLGLRHALELEREAHVLRYRHVRVERVVLEHHGDVAFLGRQVVHDAIADADLARGDFLEAGDHAQQRGLATARRANQHHEFAIGDVNRHALQRFEIAVVLAGLVDSYRRHEVSSRVWATAPLCP
jgi:hypothetical protein